MIGSGRPSSQPTRAYLIFPLRLRSSGCSSVCRWGAFMTRAPGCSKVFRTLRRVVVGMNPESCTWCAEASRRLSPGKTQARKDRWASRALPLTAINDRWRTAWRKRRTAAIRRWRAMSCDEVLNRQRASSPGWSHRWRKLDRQRPRLRGAGLGRDSLPPTGFVGMGTAPSERARGSRGKRSRSTDRVTHRRRRENSVVRSGSRERFGPSDVTPAGAGS